MGATGVLLVMLGIVLLLVAMTMEVSVEVDGSNALGFVSTRGDRVLNLGLLNLRTCGVIVSVGLLLAGVIVLCAATMMKRLDDGRSVPRKEIGP